MIRNKRPGRWDWLNSPLTTRQESSPWVASQLHSLEHAVERGAISSNILTCFRTETALADFAWRVYFHRRATGRVRPATELISGAQGYVIFMHGWAGNHAIWEDLPVQICECNPRLVCFALDVNGFGRSPFIEADYPRLSRCGPRSVMQAVELWLDLLKLHRPGPQKQVFTFVGHSMSGAALFHKVTQGWEETRYSLLALAPAMLHKDTIKQTFYRTMGVGIGAGLQYQILDSFKDRLAGPITEILAAQASRAVKQGHQRIFEGTHKGTLAQTFFALGLAEETPPARDWSNVFVMLGHKDRLVTLGPTLDLLEEMGLTSQNIQVVIGDHYFFSVSQQSRKQHGINRTYVVDHILQLHENAR